MAGLNNLHTLLENESAAKDFIAVQMEQAINRDIRDLNLVAFEGVSAEEVYADECGKNCGGGGAGLDDADDTDLDKIDEALNAMDGFDSGFESAFGPEPAPSAIPTEEQLDPEMEAALANIPEATEKECAAFFEATENDNTLDANPALEAEMVVVNMLTA